MSKKRSKKVLRKSRKIKRGSRKIKRGSRKVKRSSRKIKRTSRKIKRTSKKIKRTSKKIKRARKIKRKSRKIKRTSRKIKRTSRKFKRKLKFEQGITTTNVFLIDGFNLTVSSEAYPLVMSNDKVPHLERKENRWVFPRFPIWMQYTDTNNNNNINYFYPVKKDGTIIDIDDMGDKLLSNFIYFDKNSDQGLDCIVNGDTLIVRYVSVSNNNRISVLLKIMPYDSNLTRLELKAIDHINSNYQNYINCSNYMIRAKIPNYEENDKKWDWGYKQLQNYRYLDVWEGTPLALVIMEEVEGDLIKLIKKNVFNSNINRAADLNCIRVALKVTTAIECLYKDNLYFLDLKDDNIFIKCIGFLNSENKQETHCKKGWRNTAYTEGISDGRLNAIKEYQILLGDIGSILFPPVLSKNFIYNNSCEKAGMNTRLPPEVNITLGGNSNSIRQYNQEMHLLHNEYIESWMKLKTKFNINDNNINDNNDNVNEYKQLVKLLQKKFMDNQKKSQIKFNIVNDKYNPDKEWNHDDLEKILIFNLGCLFINLFSKVSGTSQLNLFNRFLYGMVESNPNNRPTFTELKERLTFFLNFLLTSPISIPIPIPTSTSTSTSTSISTSISTSNPVTLISDSSSNPSSSPNINSNLFGLSSNELREFNKFKKKIKSNK